MTIWLSYQPSYSINICNLIPLVKKITKFEISDLRSVTNIEMFWTSESYFFPFVDMLVWEILIEEERLHLLSIVPFF